MRCSVVADDGQRCVLDAHVGDQHDFVEPSGDPVDGGQRWSEWIRMVREVREHLLLRVVEEGGTVARESQIDQWNVDYCRAVLADVARSVGLTVETSDSAEPLKIVENKS